MGLRALSIVVLVFTLLFPSPARSQASAPSAPVVTQPPQPNPQTGEQCAKEEERGAQDAPLFMKGEITTQKSERDARDDAEDRKEKAALDRELVHYTGLSFLVAFGMVLSAIVQIGLFVWQLRLLRRSLVQAEGTAGAALKSANALHASERAYVFARVKRARLDPTAGSTPESAVTMEFINYGKTPAILIRCFGTAVILNSPPQAAPSIGHDQDQLPEGLVIASEKGMELTLQIRISYQDIMELGGGEKVLYCFGMVEYKDFLGKLHETGFCWQYNPTSARETKFDFSRDSLANHCT